jgi:hypothetical protein
VHRRGVRMCQAACAPGGAAPAPVPWIAPHATPAMLVPSLAGGIRTVLPTVQTSVVPARLLRRRPVPPGPDPLPAAARRGMGWQRREAARHGRRADGPETGAGARARRCNAPMHEGGMVARAATSALRRRKLPAGVADEPRVWYTARERKTVLPTSVCATKTGERAETRMRREAVGPRSRLAVRIPTLASNTSRVAYPPLQRVVYH